MPSALDVYEFFLKPDELNGQTVTVQIAAAQVRETFNPGSKKVEPKLTLALVGKKKKIMLNKTHVADLMKITGTDDYTQWRGWIELSPAKSQSGKDTIKISAAKNPPPRRPAGEIIDELTGQKSIQPPG